MIMILTTLMIIVISGCSRTASNYVGQVNDRNIGFEEFMIARRFQFENYVFNTGLTPNDATRQELSDRAFNNLVEGIIFQEMLRKHQITSSYQEAIDTLTARVPQVIINSGLFTENGSFNQEKYRQSLLTNEPVNLSILVRDYVDIYIPRVKLKEKVIDGYRVPEQEIQDEYLALNSSADVSIICFYPEYFSDIVILDREVRDYYNEHRVDFMTDPHIRIEYVLFPLRPNALDSMATKTRIDSIYTELQDDTPFPILAGNLSDSQTSVNRGEMPFMDLESFPVRIRSDLERLQLEEYTRPYAVTDGWVIYQLMAKTRNLVKLREIYVKHRPSQRTRDQLYDRIVNIRQLATEIGLQRTAFEYDLDLHRSEVVTPADPYIPILGKSDSLIERAVNARPGTIFEPIFHNQLQSYVLVSLLESQSRDFLQLQTVYDEIREILNVKKQRELTKQAAETYARRVNYNRILAEATKDGLPVLQFDNFNVNTSLLEIDPLLLTRAMYTQGKNRFVAQPVEGDSGFYVGVVHTLQQAKFRDMSPAERSQIRNRIVRQKGDELFAEWFQEQKESARVKDWRHRFR